MDAEIFHNIICFNLMEVVCAMFIMLQFVWPGWSEIPKWASFIQCLRSWTGPFLHTPTCLISFRFIFEDIDVYGIHDLERLPELSMM